MVERGREEERGDGGGQMAGGDPVGGVKNGGWVGWGVKSIWGISAP